MTDADELVSTFKDRLSYWLDEIGLISDMAANCERTGVPPDVRSGERAKRLFDELSAFHDKLSGPEPSIPAKSVQKRIVRSTVDVLYTEAKKAAEGLRAPL